MRVSVIAICAVFSVFVMASCIANKGSFLLINKAKEPISRGLVTVCGQTIELKDIPPGGSAPGSYKVKFDSHYDVKVDFKSGKKIQKGVGYVTTGFDFQDEITVTDTDIDITANKATLH